MISIDHHPSRRTLNQFGFLWLIFLGIFGALSWFKTSNHQAALIFWAAAILIPLIGWIIPSFMRLVFLGLSYAAFPIGFVVSHLILAVVYYLVFTPVGLLMRVLGYDPMQRNFEPEAGTYWKERPEEVEAKQYFHQF